MIDDAVARRWRHSGAVRLTRSASREKLARSRSRPGVVATAILDTKITWCHGKTDCDCSRFIMIITVEMAKPWNYHNFERAPFLTYQPENCTFIDSGITENTPLSSSSASSIFSSKRSRYDIAWPQAWKRWGPFLSKWHAIIWGKIHMKKRGIGRGW